MRSGPFQYPRSARRKYHVCCTGCTNAAEYTDVRERPALGGSGGVERHGRRECRDNRMLKNGLAACAPDVETYRRVVSNEIADTLSIKIFK